MFSTLSEAELDEMRATAEAVAMPDTCTIQALQETNVKGSVTVGYVDAYTDVPCRLMPISSREGREYVTGNKVTATAWFTLTVPYDQPISASDRVIHNGITYEVLGVASGHSLRTAQRADLARVD